MRVVSKMEEGTERGKKLWRGRFQANIPRGCLSKAERGKARD